MKKLVVFALLTMAGLAANAQTHKFICLNANGSEEYIYYSPNASPMFRYASSGRPQAVNLILMTIGKVKNGYKNYEVRFKGQQKRYKLTVFKNTLFCKNPDGTNQQFKKEERYVSEGKNGVKEYLYTAEPYRRFVYKSGAGNKKIRLKTISTDMMGLNSKVQFPGSNQIYKLKFLENRNIQCTNPDGSVQLFRKR